MTIDPDWPVTTEDDPRRVYCSNPICGGVDVHPHYHRRPEVHDAAGACEPDYHRGSVNIGWTTCRCGKVPIVVCIRCGGTEDLMDRGMAPGMTYCAPCRKAMAAT